MFKSPTACVSRAPTLCLSLLEAGALVSKTVSASRETGNSEAQVHCGDKNNFRGFSSIIRVLVSVTAFVRNPRQLRHGRGCAWDPERSSQVVLGAPVSKRKTEHL